MGPCRDGCGSRGIQLTPPSISWSCDSHQCQGQTSRKIEFYWAKWLCAKSNRSMVPKNVALPCLRVARGDWKGLGEQVLPACGAGGVLDSLHIAPQPPMAAATPSQGPPHPNLLHTLEVWQG